MPFRKAMINENNYYCYKKMMGDNGCREMIVRTRFRRWLYWLWESACELVAVAVKINERNSCGSIVNI